MSVLSSPTLCLLGIFISSYLMGAEAGKCDKGWVKNKGHCYMLPDEKLSWPEASLKCQDWNSGAHLASVVTEEEALWISTYIKKKKKKQHVWFGLRDYCRNGGWKWVDGSKFVYKAWNKNQPDNYHKNQYCGELAAPAAFKKWNDASCKKRSFYLCKYEL